MKRAFAAALVSVILVIATFAGILLTQNDSSKRLGSPNAYVGVAYCGNSVADGKLMIDRVKGYTNLFVLSSGLLQRDLNSVDELGDYAVAAGMYFLPYFGLVQPSLLSWLETAKQKWGDYLLGVYYGDEPGGQMLDAYVEFKDNATGDSITKTTYGDIVVQKVNGIVINYQLGGIIHLYEPSQSNESDISEATFYPNGTIQVIKPAAGGFHYRTYQELMEIKPFQDIDDTAQRFCAHDRENIDSLKNSTQVFTSDYALYWFDYSAGYDVVLGQVGWNFTLSQQIALMRGAASSQNKSWGIIITWKYQEPPYLANGTEILSQMSTAYECGSKYFVLFDYYEDAGNGTYGTMQEEHFQALESFWNEVVENPRVIQGSVRADSVLVLPKNYGWGTRWDGDKIWGIFTADEQEHQIWGLMQTALQEHGLNTDIVYDESEFPLPANYQNVYRIDNSG